MKIDLLNEPYAMVQSKWSYKFIQWTSLTKCIITLPILIVNTTKAKNHMSLTYH
jgi:hypothetical protein